MNNDHSYVQWIIIVETQCTLFGTYSYTYYAWYIIIDKCTQRKLKGLMVIAPLAKLNTLNDTYKSHMKCS